MDLYFLGTGAGMPSKQRNVASVALRMFEQRGAFWLFDCGEGTQQQILHSPLKLSRLEKIFISHLHGDHIYGLPGLLTSRSYSGGEEPLTLYGPPGIAEMIRLVLEISRAQLGYPLKIKEIAEGMVMEDESMTVETLKLDHRIDSYGYRITEKAKPGPLLMEKLQQAGIPSGPLYGKIKQGNDVTLQDGRVLRAEDFIGKAIPGRTIVILGDTRPCSASLKLAEQADVLVHEATFAGDLEELAHKYYHTTVTDACSTAAKAGVRTLILTHFSSRYQEADMERLLEEGRAIFNNTYLAEDFWSYAIARPYNP